MPQNPIPAALFAAAALPLAGCAMWNKFDIRDVTVTAPAGSKSVAVAVVDERIDLKKGDIVPESIGCTRSGFGVPYRVKTATKKPLAQEIAEVVVRGFGRNRKLAPPMFFADADSAKSGLRGTGTDRQILILIERYNSDTLIRTELDYAIKLEVYDPQGRLLASSSRMKTAELGGNGLLPAFHARKSILRTTGTVLSDLLSTSPISSIIE